MKTIDDSLIIGDGIYYQAVLKEVKKSKQHLQPIFEIFTNALESIKLKHQPNVKGSIKIDIFSKQSMNANEFMLHEIIIEDSGVGFDTENFERMTRYKDNRKGFFNNGSGRVQILHFFDTAKYFSVFEQGGNFKQRTFTLSKHHLFENAIISDNKLGETKETATKTVVTLHGVMDKNDEHAYNNLTASGLKKALVSRYMMDFCTNRNELPMITIVHHLGGKVLEEVTISASDIPLTDTEKEINIHYCRLSPDGKEFERSNRVEHLKLTAFKISEQELKRNELKLTSKGEIIPDTKVELMNLAPHDRLDGYRYLFMVSGAYIDARDGDTRGSINIQRREDYKKANASHMNLYSEEYIFLDDIEEEANSTISRIYPMIAAKKIEKQQDLEKLKNMFLLNEATIKSMNFGFDDTEEKILEKVYSADSRIIARKDAEIKKSIDKLDGLDPSAGDYQDMLSSITSELVKAIPLQNKASLTHYVARRKLVLELFGMILARELEVQRTGQRNIDEKLLHNLIFQQSASSPEESDLWLINEDFIYFKGTSEGRLCDIEVNGEKIFKDEFSVEEERYLHSLGANRTVKKPDVLLFPDEGKCIIVEFKNTNVDISNYLHQINKYAYLIRNFSKEKFHLETFFGYLIGESIEARDVRSCDGNFVEAYHFDYLFRPRETVVGEDGRRDGSLYSEVIKYSTLLERAKKRNEIFIKKLTKTKPTDITSNDHQNL